MADPKVTRRLAAILAADMVGYSRLMGLDETDTIARQKSIIAGVFEPRLAAHEGRLVKTTGDGLLIEFASAVEAVDCATEIQRDIAQRQGDVPDDRRIRYRIGINLGEIVFDGDDILGDGVNVAARLEALAEPGGILVSDAVFKNVAGKLPVDFVSLGPQKAKNIAEPIETYGVLLDAAATAVPRAHREKRRSLPALAIAAVLIFVVAAGVVWWQPWQTTRGPAETGGTTQRVEKPSIAVLPFTNLSGDKSQEYFSDGLATDLTTDLSRISGLTVIARTSAFAYKGQSTDMRKIGKELGARYLIEGSVLKIGQRIRINAQLVEAKEGKQLWAARFDRKAAELFAVQDELRAKIVQALRIKLSGRESKWLGKRLTSSPEAYDLYLRGLQQESYFTRAGNRESRELFQRALEIDPEFAAACAHLAQAYSLAQELRWTKQTDEFARKALALAKKAVALDADLPYAHWTLARVYSRAPLRDQKIAISELRRAIELDQNYADAYAFLADLLSASGRSEEALGKMEKAMRINPRFPFWYYFVLGRTQFHLTRFEAAVKSFKKATQRNPTVPWPRKYLIATYGHLGRKDDAEWEISELEGLGQKVSIAAFMKTVSVSDPTYVKLYRDGLRKAGVPEK